MQENQKLLEEYETKPINDIRYGHGCCRDLICLIIFSLGLIGMVVILILGFFKGDPRKLIYPLNSEGYYCGIKNESVDGLQNYPLLFRPAIMNASLEICVKSCPSHGILCLNYNKSSLEGEFTNDDQEACVKRGSMFTYDSLEIIRRCVPTDLKETIPGWEQIQNVFTTLVTDFSQGYWILILAVVIAVVSSFLFTLLFQCLGKFMIYTIITLTIIADLLISLYLIIYGQSNHQCRQNHGSVKRS
ncbi:MAG: hypothetical protein EZS28_042844 [Streblomastix strix]|uniref:Uncharacterized protein n=1 Tax=Streblomastix strix TaxID=222440 RepID=A0A5J4TUU2_9EUKA|nr:MAG: hypothetical protein EZS28_042844 [Streblomastix strix]